MKKSLIAPLLLAAGLAAPASADTHHLLIQVDSKRELQDVLDMEQEIADRGGLRLTLKDAKSEPEAKFFAHYLYRFGVGVPVEEETSLEYLADAVAAGHTPSMLLQLTRIGAATPALEPVPADKISPEKRDEARMLIRRAAFDGDLDAQYLMGYHHLHGDLLPRDPMKGLYMLNQAASQGQRSAIKLLKQTYENTPHLGIDYTRAYTDAYRGDTQALLKLADYYYQGDLVKQDIPHAIELAEFAYRLGNRAAADRLKAWGYRF